VRKASELVAYLPISERTFYEWQLHESQEILAKIHACKVARKAAMRRKWIASDVPALQIAAYKLEADDEEVDILSTSRVKQDTNLKVTESRVVVMSSDGTKADLSNAGI
jgi:hypothetical protein